MLGWYVVRTQHLREPWACENLLRQGAEPYLPRIAEKVRRTGTPHLLRARCLFPTYVFVRTEAGQWRFLLGTWGVSSLVMCGDLPATLPDTEIAKLRAREEDGLVKLPERPPLINRFKPNDRVRANNGAFSGFVGLYQGIAPHGRQKVLMDFLGRKTSVLIADEHLEDAGAY